MRNIDSKTADSLKRLEAMALGVLEGIAVLEKAWKGSVYFHDEWIAIASDMTLATVKALLPAMKVAGLVKKGGYPDRWARA